KPSRATSSGFSDTSNSGSRLNSSSTMSLKSLSWPRRSRYATTGVGALALPSCDPSRGVVRNSVFSPSTIRGQSTAGTFRNSVVAVARSAPAGLPMSHPGGPHLRRRQPAHRLRVRPEVQRVPRAAVLRLTQQVDRLGHACEHRPDLVLARAGTVRAPGRDHDVTVETRLHEVGVVGRSERGAALCLHDTWVSGAEGIGVEHPPRAVAPVLCEANAPSDGRVVLCLVGRGRVQADERTDALVTVPVAPQQVAPAATGGEDGPGVERVKRVEHLSPPPRVPSPTEARPPGRTAPGTCAARSAAG